MDSTLIKNTTKEEREQIVSESIGNINGACDGCAAGLAEMYRDYIDGRKEIRDINMEFSVQHESVMKGFEIRTIKPNNNREYECAEEKDIRELYDLQLRAFESEAEMIGSRNVPALMESYEENREDFDNWTVLVKRDDSGKIIGAARYREEGDHVEIGRVMVAPEWRNRGIAMGLMTAVEDLTRAKVFELYTCTKSYININLYKKLGYKIYKVEQGDRDLSFAYMRKNGFMIRLEPLQAEDREQFIIDNQEAFNYGALEEFGLRDDHMEEDGQIISRDTIERSIDAGEAYRIIKDGEKVGGAVLKVDGNHGELELLFVSPKAHSKGIGHAAWCEIERLHPEVDVWETVTPYFEKRNIHFYVNRCGFHIVEFYNDHYPDPNDSCGEEDTDDQFPEGMFRFEKRMR